MPHLNIGPRLSLAFGVLVTFLVAVGGLGLARLSELNEHIHEITQQRWSEARLAQEGIALVGEQTGHVTRLFLLKDPAEVDRTLADIASVRDRANVVVKKREATLSGPIERALFDDLGVQRLAYIDAFAKARALLAEGRRDEAQELALREVVPALQRVHGAWEKLLDHETERLGDAARASEAAFRQARALILGLILAAALLAIAIALLVTRSVVVPIG